MAAGYRTGLLGTIETRIGDVTIEHTPGSGLTTPEAADLHALLAVMEQAGVTHVVMEVSSHALSLGRVAGLGFDVAGFANLSQDHLDFHHTIEEYFAAKAMLFDGRARRHVVNTDDAYGERIAALAPDRTATVSPAGQAADWRADDVRLAPDGTRFVARAATGDLPVELPLPGSFNVANALLPSGCSPRPGSTWRPPCPGSLTVAVPGRMQRIEVGQPYAAIVDYAHKPAAVEAVVAALRPQTQRRIILVLGCGGDRDREKRAMMGAVGARLADVLIVTDDNPRTEDPAAIRAAMLAGVTELPQAARADVIEDGDRASAIRRAVAMAGRGDTIIVAGKGHEHGQYVGDRVLDFDDAASAAAAIEDAG